jgi:hypothetical protein
MVNGPRPHPDERGVCRVGGQELEVSMFEAANERLTIGTPDREDTIKVKGSKAKELELGAQVHNIGNILRKDPLAEIELLEISALRRKADGSGRDVRSQNVPVLLSDVLVSPEGGQLPSGFLIEKWP